MNKLILGASMVVSATTLSFAQQVERPNIVIVLADDLGWGDVGFHGSEIKTPCLNALAAEGVVLDRFYTAPISTPTRAGLMTGRYPNRFGIRTTVIPPWREDGLDENEETLADMLARNGYSNRAIIGKWHLASDGELEKKPTIDHTITAIPKELRGGYTGFWRASDVLEFTSHGYDGYVFDENNNRIDFKGYRPDCITDMALEFFDTYDRKKPFFMTISQIEPHHQNDHNHYEGPEGSKEKYKNFVLPADLAALGGDYKEEYPDYLGACAALDRNLGKVIDRLKKEGLYENTVIIFGADHGSHFKTRNRDGHLNGYDDYKRSGHDAALRVPLVIAGGPFKGGKVEEQIVSTASLPKTILALAGVDVGDKMIGENLADVVAGNTPNRVNEAFAQISESRCGRCIRTPDFLYAVYAPGVNGGEAAAADVYADDYLYDLRVDPVQLNNVVADPAYAEAKAMLRGRLFDWIKRAEGAEPTIVD